MCGIIDFIARPMLPGFGPLVTQLNVQFVAFAGMHVTYCHMLIPAVHMTAELSANTRFR